jgi:4-carboxymuconolactone decarboxylase
MTPREKGNATTRLLMGAEQSERLSAAAESDTFGSDIAGYAIDHVFGDIWTRKGLDLPRRSLVTMAVMVALRQPHEFGLHMNSTLDNGMALHEIEEALIHMLPYVGFPAVSSVLPVATKIVAERGLDKKSEAVILPGSTWSSMEVQPQFRGRRSHEAKRAGPRSSFASIYAPTRSPKVTSVCEEV